MPTMFVVAALAMGQAMPAPVPAGEDPVAPYTQSDANAGATPFAGDEMWHAFHGTAGVAHIVDVTIDRSIADPRISDIFKGQDMVRLRRLLREQICYILNGGCAYSGRTMADAHRNMGIQTADLAALVENLQAGMRAEHVGFRAQNRLLAKLAPMRPALLLRAKPRPAQVVPSDQPGN